jgi:hypothetical protein
MLHCTRSTTVTSRLCGSPSDMPLESHGICGTYDPTGTDCRIARRSLAEFFAQRPCPLTLRQHRSRRHGGPDDTDIEKQLPKPIKRVRFPLSAPRLPSANTVRTLVRLRGWS